MSDSTRRRAPMQIEFKVKVSGHGILDELNHEKPPMRDWILVNIESQEDVNVLRLALERLIREEKERMGHG